MNTIIRITSDSISTMLSQEQQQEILLSQEQINSGLFVTQSDLDAELTNGWRNNLPPSRLERSEMERSMH